MYDIVFLGKKNKRWDKLKTKFPTAKHAETIEDLSKKVFTKMFWIVYNDIEVDDAFDFSYKVNEYDQHYIHLFLHNNSTYNGIVLCPKNRVLLENEVVARVFVDTKEISINASIDIYDVVFISYNELEADNNYERLLLFAPHALRVHGITGIHQAHIEAAKLCSTKMFWIIDGDAKIIDNFDFTQIVEDLTSVYVWRSQNPINGLVYGYGGVKLFPRELTLTMDVSKPDMTTSISKNFRIQDQISNITAFNTDPFSTWRSAFRECVKLSSQSIDRQKENESARRLKIWTTVGADKLFGEYAIAGAIAGKEYGTANAGSTDALRRINDFNWLKERFDDSQK